jgi:hypothetical protein
VSDLLNYARTLGQKRARTVDSAEIFAKVLAPNDDAGRHGVLVPSNVYSFFPDFEIKDPKENATLIFRAFDAISGGEKDFGYKYYQRYPERRITRLPNLINTRSADPRIVVFVRVRDPDGSFYYYVDCANSAPGGRFRELFRAVFLEEMAPEPGAYITRPTGPVPFTADQALSELLDRFDDVAGRGWIDSLRAGDTGIGYTFETLLGIRENNDRRADYKGIELKCKAVKDGSSYSTGKINLFQQGPVWTTGLSAKELLQLIGRQRPDGFYACNSQVTTRANNLGLAISVIDLESKVDLLRRFDRLGYWPFAKLAERLKEKHSRAAIVKAKSRQTKAKDQFKYEEFIYCEQPSIDRFVTLVRNRNIVFEFLMREEQGGNVRNRGYPWRLVREEFLDQLYAFQIKLR